MTMDEKKEIAKEFYDKLGLTNYTLEWKRDNEINADFVWVPDMRGPGGLIIGDNGDYLFCQSMHDFNYWKEEYKKGVRTSGENDDSLKLSNGKCAEDVETKQAFEDYMSKVDNYNEQVANGEKPDVKMGDLLNEYNDTFYDESYEKKLKKIEEDFNNRERVSKIDDLIHKVDEQLANIEKQENESMMVVPNLLKGFISFDEDGYAFANQKLPIELEEDYSNFIHNYYDDEDNKVVNTIINKIMELPFDTETTIAELINYDPKISPVSPLTQGIISRSVFTKCVAKGIKLEENTDVIGGLAYFVEFKKINI